MWANAPAYERYVGRWSRLIAGQFIAWLEVPGRARWLDVGCGTGAVSAAIVATARPELVDAIDVSEGQLELARRAVSDPRVRFELGDARWLRGEPDYYHAVVAGLVFPAIDYPNAVLEQFVRAAFQLGIVGVYVWDFEGEMQPLRQFWEAANALAPGSDEPDGERFAICRPDGLRAALEGARLQEVRVEPIDAVARFTDFDDYWTPFLSGDAPAQRHVQSLSPEARTALRERLRGSLPIASDGSIELRVRVWAGKGKKPPHRCSAAEVDYWNDLEDKRIVRLGLDPRDPIGNIATVERILEEMEAEAGADEDD